MYSRSIFSEGIIKLPLAIMFCSVMVITFPKCGPCSCRLSPGFTFNHLIRLHVPSRSIYTCKTPIKQNICLHVHAPKQSVALNQCVRCCKKKKKKKIEFLYRVSNMINLSFHHGFFM